MKKIFIQIICLFLFGSTYSQGEWVSASLDNGPTPNKTGLYIRSTTEFDANQCDNIVFTVRIPKTSGSAITMVANFPMPSYFSHLTFTTQKLNVDDGIYYYYLINGTGNVNPTPGQIIGINTPVKVLELTYSGGINNSIVQLANIENDIPGNTFLRPQFYIQINMGDITSQTNMFFGLGGALPVNNQTITGNDFVGTTNVVLLPVKFNSFIVNKSGNNAALSWSVENENTNTDRYEIERSFNARDFLKIGTTAPKNNGSTLNGYSSMDYNLSALRSSGILYYRIKQIDKDGKAVTTEIRSVRINGKAFTASVYPNPVEKLTSVNIDLTDVTQLNIFVTDAAGKEINRGSLDGIKGLNIYSLDMSRFAAGTYFINIVAGDERKTISVVKKK